MSVELVVNVLVEAMRGDERGDADDMGRRRPDERDVVAVAEEDGEREVDAEPRTAR